ncbi:MAG: PLD nuclease N-terminal domain-containing protein [Actinomycetaceae bacterium]|nr:PLD nuclease N-terminal domain-containing protein [Actinomycetaceae bacterium]
MPRVALAIFVVAVWIYGIIDCARTPRSAMPGRLPKWVWMLLVFVPVLGAVLWLVLSWPIKHPEGFGTLPLGPRQAAQPSSAPVAPDDDPEFLAKLDARNRFAEWEREQARKGSEGGEAGNLDDELQALLADEDAVGRALSDDDATGKGDKGSGTDSSEESGNGRADNADNEADGSPGDDAPTPAAG